MITYEDFKKVEIRAGKILSAEKIPDTDKLLKLSVDFAEPAGPRQIVSGIAMYYPDPSALVGKTCMFVTNLEPRKIRGFESNGMLFALSASLKQEMPAPIESAEPAEPAELPEMPPPQPEPAPKIFSLLEPDSSIPPGTLAG